MKCESCGTANADDARYCKHCGKPVDDAVLGEPMVSKTMKDDPSAADEARKEVLTPGDEVVGAEGGSAESSADSTVKDDPVVPLPAVSLSGDGVNDTVKGQPVPKLGSKKAAPVETGEADLDFGGTLQGSPSPGHGEKRREAKTDPTVRAQRPLESPSGQMPSDSMVASMSIRLSEIGVETPSRLLSMAVIVAVVLFALGAGAMYFTMRFRAGPPASVATGVPQEDVGLVIGMPQARAVSTESGVGGGQELPERRQGSSGGSSSNRTTAGSSRPGVTSGGSATDNDRSAPPESAPSSSSAGRGGGLSSPSAATGESASADDGAASTPSSGSSGGSDRPLPPPPDDEMEERDPAVGAYAGQVRYVIQRFYGARAQSCFERASRERAEPLFGTVVVQFDVGADGNVQRATPVRNTTGSPDLGACVAGQVGSWRLPAPPGGPITMEMPFSQ